ncbi:nuclear pore complex subunit [Malassezia sp. CBS 17886]|nr:nuclear pore complex subunit [Malassezia sp. CBS 17886]
MSARAPRRSLFRPCIDLHAGKVKQIVGGTLRTAHGGVGDDQHVLRTNFVAEKPPAYYAELYRSHGLRGGHIIKLGPGNDAAAEAAVAAWPDGMHVGGGINAANARGWIDRGAEKVVVTSYLFPDCKFSMERLLEMERVVGRDRLVVDISCRRHGDEWIVAMNRWQDLTDMFLTQATLNTVSAHCSELLVHAADVEGLCQGIDEDLVTHLADLVLVDRLSRGKVDVTFGSALDIFGGSGVTLEAGEHRHVGAAADRETMRTAAGLSQTALVPPSLSRDSMDARGDERALATVEQPVAMDPFPAQAAGAAAQPAVSLSDLLQQSRKLTNQQGRDSDLPSIQLGIDQIESQSRKLVSKSVRSGHPGADARAHYLLASGGIDAARLTSAIQQTDIANTFEPLQPVYDTDIDGYVRHEHEQVILSLIEESRRQTLDDFDQTLRANLHRDWQEQKRHLLEEIGQYCVDEGDAGGGATGALRSLSSTPGPAARGARADAADALPSAAQLHSRMIRYDTVVARLNRARREGQPMPLIHAFMEVTESFVQDDARRRGLLDAWTVLKCLVHETSGGLPKPVPAREYAHVYGDLDVFRGPRGLALRQKWIRGARAFLEAQFAEYMEQVIAANPVRAQRGGVPSVRATVAAFLRAHLREPQGAWPAMVRVRGAACDRSPQRQMDAATQTPLWALLFYLLRIGETAEALRCAQENEDALQRTDAGFIAFFKAWADDADHALPRAMRDQLMAEYVTRFRSVSLDALDAYHYALYRLLGRFDVAKRFPAALAPSTESWLWLQLSMVTESDGDSAQDPTLQAHSLHDLAQKLEKYGPAHFDPKGSRPLHYFQLLFLVGAFERAIGFLHSRPAYQVDVVHFAAALTYYGLLRVPRASAASQFDCLTVATDRGVQVAYVDFARLIQRYLRLFTPSSRRDALEYISLVALNADAPAPVGAEQVHACQELVRSLLLESTTSGFAELLGDVRADGSKTPGLIEQNLALLHLQGQRDFLRTIVQSAAHQCEGEQRVTDAVLLYDSAGDYDTVLAVLNRALSATLRDPAPPAAWAEDTQQLHASLSSIQSVVVLARCVLARYAQQLGYRSAQTDVCHTLLGLKRAVSLYDDNQLLPALQVLEGLHVLPLDTDARKDVVSITRKAEDFKNYDETITRNFSDVVLMAMTILYKLHQSLKDSVTRTDSGALFEYRSQARALMMWAGMLRFRMSNDTYSQLTRLDVYIH